MSGEKSPRRNVRGGNVRGEMPGGMSGEKCTGGNVHGGGGGGGLPIDPRD